MTYYYRQVGQALRFIESRKPVMTMVGPMMTSMIQSHTPTSPLHHNHLSLPWGHHNHLSITCRLLCKRTLHRPRWLWTGDEERPIKYWATSQYKERKPSLLASRPLNTCSQITNTCTKYQKWYRYKFSTGTSRVYVTWPLFHFKYDISQ